MYEGFLLLTASNVVLAHAHRVVPAQAGRYGAPSRLVKYKHPLSRESLAARGYDSREQPVRADIDEGT